MPVFDSSIQRKNRSNQALTLLGIPTSKSLPPIEADEEITLRSGPVLARRALVLWAVSAKALSPGDSDLVKFVDDAGLWQDVSPKEKVFLRAAKVSEKDKQTHSWRAEALWTILWALGDVKKLDLPGKECDVNKLTQIMNQLIAKDHGKHFVAAAKTRAENEILDEKDITYRLHWAIVDARTKGQKLPAQASSDITVERHYALNWLTKYMNQDWDDVSPDT